MPQEPSKLASSPQLKKRKKKKWQSNTRYVAAHTIPSLNTLQSSYRGLKQQHSCETRQA